MAEHGDDNKLDQLLDSLLAEYSSVEPRPGLQTHILAAVRAKAAQRQSRSWQWLWAATATAAAAAIVLVAVQLRLRDVPQPQAPHIAAGVPIRSNEISSWSTGENVIAKTQPHNPRHRAVPQRSQRGAEVIQASVRQDVFPAPAPISQQERYLLQYVSRTPRDEILAQGATDDQRLEAFLQGRPLRQWMPEILQINSNR